MARTDAIDLLDRLRDEYDLLIQTHAQEAADATLQQMCFICKVIDARTKENNKLGGNDISDATQASDDRLP